MIYEYRCIMCDRHYDVIKPVSLCSREEYCPTCKLNLDRVYTVPRYNFMTLTPREHEDLTKHKLETGSDLVCIGDDRKALENIRPKMAEYDLPREVMATLEN